MVLLQAQTTYLVSDHHHNVYLRRSPPSFLPNKHAILVPMPISKIKSRACRRSSTIQCCLSSPSPPAEIDPDGNRKVPQLNTLLRRFWKVAAPYWYSDDKVQARLQLAAVFALTLATTGISVGFSFLGRDFYNALANKDQEQFTKQLLYYLGGFAGGIPVRYSA